MCEAISDECEPVNKVSHNHVGDGGGQAQHAETYHNLHTLVEAVWEVETRERTNSCSSAGSEGVHVSPVLGLPHYSYSAAGRAF